MRLWKRISDLTINKILTIGKNANLAIMNSAGKAVTVIAGIPQRVLITVETLTSKAFGQTMMLSIAGGAIITLPAPTEGARIKFIVAIAPTSVGYIIACGAGLLYGGTTCSDGGVGQSAAGGANFTFVSAQSDIGDAVEFYSDGTYWYLSGFTADAAGGLVS